MEQNEGLILRRHICGFFVKFELFFFLDKLQFSVTCQNLLTSVLTSARLSSNIWWKKS